MRTEFQPLFGLLYLCLAERRAKMRPDVELKTKNIHLMGIGGAGMSGLAKLLDQFGAKVSGCDENENVYTAKLRELGIPVEIGHSVEHFKKFNPDILVFSSAVPQDHPEMTAAWQKGIRVARRAEILSIIFNACSGVGVAGTHGKTTTSSMISLTAEMAGLDPSIAVGGEVIEIGTNANLGKGKYMIAELDESDRSFVYFHPEIAIITNIDWDHRDHYMTFKAVTDAFNEFLSNRKECGKSILCMEDPGVKTLFSDYGVKDGVITYGWGTGWNWGATDIKHIQGGGAVYSLSHDGKIVDTIELRVSGEHNILNSLATCAAAYEMGINLEVVKAALAKFSGAKRRLQKMGQIGDILVYDDYGHHPNEIKATLSTVRKIFEGRRIIAVFQPHRFSRTAALYKEFAEALSYADRAFILPIYSSSETPMEGVSSRMIFDAITADQKSHYSLCGNFDELLKSVCNLASDGDVILTIGAGSVGGLGYKICDMLKNMREEK